jgi:hypothetical protein
MLTKGDHAPNLSDADQFGFALPVAAIAVLNLNKKD